MLSIVHTSGKYRKAFDWVRRRYADQHWAKPWPRDRTGAFWGWLQGEEA
jgi:hypothetical protein